MGERKRFLKSLLGGGGRRKSIVVAVPMHKTPEPKMIINMLDVCNDFINQGTDHVIGQMLQCDSRLEDAEGKALKACVDDPTSVGVLFWEDDMVVPFRVAEKGHDAAFNPILRLMSHDKDIIGAAYTTRLQQECRPIMGQANEEGLPRCITEEGQWPITTEPFRCDFVGMGFTWVSRRAILRMMDVLGDDCRKFFEPESVAFMERHVEFRLDGFLKEQPTARAVLDFVNREIRLSAWMKTDYAFCHRARECGLEVWCDPSFGVAHLGTYGYTREFWLAGKMLAAERLAAKG